MKEIVASANVTRDELVSYARRWFCKVFSETMIGMVCVTRCDDSMPIWERKNIVVVVKTVTRVPSVVIFPCDLALWVGWWVVVVCGGEGDTASSEWAFSSICVPLCTGRLPSSKSSIIIIMMIIITIAICNPQQVRLNW